MSRLSIVVSPLGVNPAFGRAELGGGPLGLKLLAAKLTFHIDVGFKRPSVRGCTSAPIRAVLRLRSRLRRPVPDVDLFARSAMADTLTILVFALNAVLQGSRMLVIRTSLA